MDIFREDFFIARGTATSSLGHRRWIQALPSNAPLIIPRYHSKIKSRRSYNVFSISGSGDCISHPCNLKAPTSSRMTRVPNVFPSRCRTSLSHLASAWDARFKRKFFICIGIIHSRISFPVDGSRRAKYIRAKSPR